jgi:flagellar protein FliO/FliZ
MRSAGRIPLAFLAALLLAAGAADAQVPSASKSEEGDRWIIPPHKIDRKAAQTPASSSAWWTGTVGIALALAAFGGISVAARRLRLLPSRPEAGMLRVVGRTSLSPKHNVYLLQAGDRVLIVGTGPQGSPTLLGEMPSEAPVATPRAARLRVGGDA